MPRRAEMRGSTAFCPPRGRCKGDARRRERRAPIVSARGVKLVSGGTDNHLLLIDLTDEDCTGKELEHNLDEVHITANKNTVPGEKRSPFVTSGVRIGTPAVTTRGMGPDEMKVIADCIADCVFDFANKKDEVARKVEELTKKFPLYE